MKATEKYFLVVYLHKVALLISVLQTKTYKLKLCPLDILRINLKVHMTRIFFISLLERAFKMMKSGVYFIVIALLVAELSKILIYAN